MCRDQQSRSLRRRTWPRWVRRWPWRIWRWYSGNTGRDWWESFLGWRSWNSGWRFRRYWRPWGSREQSWPWRLRTSGRTFEEGGQSSGWCWNWGRVQFWLWRTARNDNELIFFCFCKLLNLILINVVNYYFVYINSEGQYHWLIFDENLMIRIKTLRSCSE